MSSDNLILYHNDHDGACAAWVVRHFLREDAEARPVVYGDPIPTDTTGKHVWIVDFSWSATELRKIGANCTDLTLFDHHKTARPELVELCSLHDEQDEVGPFSFGSSGVINTVVYDPDKSGCGIAWDTLFPRAKRPWWVAYVDDRDLWRWELPNSKEINTYLQSFEADPAIFDTFNWFDSPQGLPPTRDVSGARRAGEHILRYQAKLVKEAIHGAQTEPILGWVVPMVRSQILLSEIGHALLEAHPDAPFVAVLYRTPSGAIGYSLRSENRREDVGEIARAAGGGGHRNAAGFKIYPVPKPTDWKE